MLLPIYGQKMFCDYYTYWGLGYHYSVEFLPIITIGCFTIINEFEKQKVRRILLYLLIILTSAVTMRSLDHTYTYFNRVKQRFYQKPHYSRSFDVKELYASLKYIPADAAVCAQDEFVPHLCSVKKFIFIHMLKMPDIFLLIPKQTFILSKQKKNMMQT